MRILTWDLEIEKPVESLSGGWTEAREGGAGISCLVVRDNETGRSHLYDKHTLDAAVDHLNEADLLVGYNSVSFDSAVLLGVTNRHICVPQYDILAKIWEALGSRQKGWKLDDVASRTLGLHKSGKGIYATALWAQARYAELFDYCMGDVHITAAVFNHIVANGWILDPDGNHLHLDHPGTEDLA